MIILGTNSIKDTGFNVANSCRFNDGDSACMHKTPSSSGNRRTFTFSTWVKKTNDLTSNVYNDLYSAYDDANNISRILFWDSNALTLSNKVSGSFPTFIRTNRLFKDPTAWYHLVIAVDTTDGTEANRVKIYVNGIQETSLESSNYPSQNEDFFFNHTNEHNVGQQGDDDSALYFDGYLAETVMIDGLQLAPTSFGEFDEDTPKTWKPIDVSGLTFGTNGFYLDYEDSSNLGNDKSGGTDFTEVNLAATDQATDTPTNNFCTFNSLYNFNVDPTYSEGNCLLTFGSTWGGGKATMAVDKGKWYWEAKLSGNMNNHFHGIQEVNVSGNLTASNPMNLDGSVMFFNQDGGEMRKDDTDTTNDYGTFSDGDIIGIALNMDGGSYGQITIYKNGSAIVSDYDLSSNNDLVAPFTAGGGTMSYNFGGSPSFTISSGNADGNGYGNFEYAVPSGYYALCTKNLAEYG